MEYAMGELEKNKGTQFDPEVADAFIELIKEGKVPCRTDSKKEAPTGASFQKGRIKYYRIFRKIKGGDPMIVVVCPGFVGLYIPD